MIATSSNIIYATGASYISEINQEWTGTGNTIYSPYRNSTCCTEDSAITYYTPSTTVYETGSPCFHKWGMDFYISNYLADNEYIIIPDSSYYLHPSKIQMKKAEIQSNLLIQVKSRSNASQYPGETEPERKALETLRETITEAEFRKYLRYGFVLVKGQSGKTYQIFKNKSHCKVWLGGKLIEEVCVRIKDVQVPKTDNVIAFKTMIEASEENFKTLGNVYKMAM
jgi:hypothetical protein